MKRYIYFEVSSVAVADAVSVLSDVCVILVEEGGLDFCEWGSESESVFDVVLLLLLLLYCWHHCYYCCYCCCDCSYYDCVLYYYCYHYYYYYYYY